MPEPPLAPQPSPPAGWYADPWQRAAYRWWDGSAWTGAVSDGWIDPRSGGGDGSAGAGGDHGPGGDAEPRWGMGDIGFGLLVWLGVSAVVASLMIAAGADLDDTAPLVVAGVFANTLGFFGWPVVATYRKGRRSLRRDFRLAVAWADIGWAVVAAIACLAGLVAIQAGFDALFPQVESMGNSEEIRDAVGSPGSFVVLFVAVALITPFAEEVFFRGLVLRSIQKRWGTGAAIPLSAVVFGVLHYPPGSSPAEVTVLIVALIWYGAVMAFATVRTDRLGAAIGAHVIVNGLVMVAAAADSGLVG